MQQQQLPSASCMWRERSTHLRQAVDGALHGDQLLLQHPVCRWTSSSRMQVRTPHRRCNAEGRFSKGLTALQKGHRGGVRPACLA